MYLKIKLRQIACVNKNTWSKSGLNLIYCISLYVEQSHLQSNTDSFNPGAVKTMSMNSTCIERRLFQNIPMAN